MDLGATLDFLAARAIPGVEALRRHDVHAARCACRAARRWPRSATAAGTSRASLRLTDQRDLIAAVARLRRLLDLDADPVAIDNLLGADPQLALLVRKRAGLRSPGAVDGFEMAMRAVVGQQISVSGARTILGRIAAEHGTIAFEGEPWVLFPSADDFAATDPATLPMPRKRAATLHAVAAEVASGGLTLDPERRP